MAATSTVVWAVLSLLPNLGLGLAGLWLRAFDRSGLLAGIIAGWLITYAFGIGGFFTMVGFVALGSVATRIGYARKAERGIAEAHGGRRTWKSAVGNLAVPSVLAVVELTKGGGIVLLLALVGSLSAAAFDTVASEMGKAFGRRALSLLDLKIGDAGIPGGISFQGTLGGACGSLGVCLIASAFGLIGFEHIGLVMIASAVAMVIEGWIKAWGIARSPQIANFINTAAGAGLASVGSVFWLA